MGCSQVEYMNHHECSATDALFFLLLLSGQEVDGQDETIIPIDYEKAGQIVDDDLHEILVAGLPKGVRLTAIMDCCHSGSVFDLPYTVSTQSRIP